MNRTVHGFPFAWKGPFPQSASVPGVSIPHIQSTAAMKTTIPFLVASLLSALSATGEDAIPLTVYGGSTDFEKIEMSDEEIIQQSTVNALFQHMFAACGYKLSTVEGVEDAAI